MLLLLLGAALCGSGRASLTSLPRPESLVSCPGMQRKGESGFTCKDTPVRYQAVVPVNALRAVGINECDVYDYTTAAGSASDHNGACRVDQEPCTDSRDCCSDYCSWSETKNFAVCAPPRARLRSLRTLAPHRQLTHDEKAQPCTGNAECRSYRCKNGFCDDKVAQGFAGSDGCEIPALHVMYTVQLDGEANPGDPSMSNAENTWWISPGEFGEISFPGNMVIRTRLQYCGVANNYQCVDSAVYTTTVEVGANDGPHNAARPPENSDSVYVRSAITFDSFDGAASKFNSTGFKLAVMDALNTDRLEYTPGNAEGKQLFAEVKADDVSVIVIDPQEKTVQFEVRTKKEEDAGHLSARMLHAYFKFPLAVFLSKYSVLNETAYACAWNQAKRIHVEASGASLLRADRPKGISVEVGLAAVAIVFIVLGGILVCAGGVWVFVRSREQAKVASMLSYKAASLNKREAELAQNLEQLEGQKSALLKETAKLKRVAEERAKEYAAAQEKLKALASEETSEIDALNASLDEEHAREMAAIETQLAKEKEDVLKKLESSGPEAEIALDADTIEHRMDALVISAGTTSAQAQRDLDERHAKMRARTAHRNELRRAKLKMKLEQEASQALATLETAKEQQQELEVRIGDMVLSSSQDTATLQSMLENRKMSVLQRTKERNEKRKAEMERRLAEEKSKVMNVVPPEADITLPATLVPDDHDHEAHGIALEEAAEESDILGNPAHHERVTTIVLKANMNKQELAAQLAERREVLLARTRARNEHRKHQRIKAKRKEQAEKMPDDARRASLNVHRLHDLVKASQEKLKNNENKVKDLEAEAQQHRKELDESLATR